MVKEYVDGLTLKEYIQRRHHMNSDEIVKVSLKIAEAQMCIRDRIDNVFRWKLLVSHPEEEKLIAYGDYCLARFQEQNRQVKVTADLNPVYMF